ncbi:MAG: glycerate kinase [Zymomonas mobilis subsp. pomaceae]|uniref:Glycerate kinase n=1 Tax=Zymomonas mobilis subsp. pomaceae (strain ATCC 29192 / DSM 22645 / JCM 10191 / CCUG 17912 / NBRC 13757 / NCIMB 11200 / NRRL B-4491 / Barker I) TaxID=579138 RepID=F8EV87_ZYMMT|nr:glycerate kinase [Zymomonas mobilis]AEI38305.1 glycerate kinase [Zymomonas mobilis subsp. pomaceae ATCC 29192]MDX5947994.1 glycerate kinase [Zymomonas mobilis subsp. pomaceae]GEB89324.1 glycerate kinase [Zymomonas mobilis subsp. pomaceae]
MKFVLAPDSFKGSLTAKQAATAMQKGIQKIFPEADFIQLPMADGGEGTVEALVDATHGQFIETTVANPFMQETKARYGLLGDRKTAVIEMAAASGLQFVNDQTKNPLLTTTYGTGQLIKSALDHKAKKIIIGMGGSATNDGGAGMAQALGVRLLNNQGQSIEKGGGGLAELSTLDITEIDPRLLETEIVIASDVTNPLVGDKGASAVFGPQKGATSTMIAQLDKNLRHYAALIKEKTGKDIADYPGAGAAGGLSAGLLAFTSATLEAGVKIVVQMTGLIPKTQDADFVFTGEGHVDFQTQYGKTPMGVAQAAKKSNPKTTVILLAGAVGEKIEELYSLGIDVILATTPGVLTLTEAMKHAEENLARTAENVARLIKTQQHFHCS